MAESSETGRGLRLLSLDGGGIRGLSELLIIEIIMKRVQSHLNLQNTPRPAEHFDLIGGTSTGGLIAILLGRLGLSAGEAIEVYRRLAERIFSERKPKWKDGAFKATVLEDEIKSVVREILGPEQADAKMLEDEGPEQRCKMFVCATPALNTAFRRRFRNYRVPRHESYNCTIWEAGRATSAAPTFFKRIKIDGEHFVDAGLGCNNPIKEVIAEAKLVFGKERKVDCIVSIGTGKAGVVGFDKPTGLQTILPTDLVNVLKKMVTESSSTAEEMEQRYEAVRNLYFRFDVDQGLQDVGLEEWKRLEDVKTHTITYTMETNIDRKIDAVVTSLIGTPSPKAYTLAQLDGRITSMQSSEASAKQSRLEPTSTVPFIRDRDFIDRGNIMAKVSETLSYPGGRVALLGFGGIGKSQLAIEYAHRVRDEAPLTWVFWVHASNQARMEEGFEQIARILDIPGRDDPKANIFQIVGQWLKDTSEKWLLVVDNADDPIMFSSLAREEKAKEESANGNPGLLTFPPLVNPHLPQTQNGSILITSRNEEASLALVGEDKNIIHVGEMSEKESLDLFFKKLNEEVDRQGAPDLVKGLEYIPLAITQAAAFLSRQKGRVGIARYVKDINKSIGEAIHPLKREFVNSRRDGCPESTFATWQISFEHIRQNWPSAAEMLSLMSFFNYQGVPEFLLKDRQDPELGERINEDLDESFEKYLQILRDYCLVSIGRETGTLRMHRLVQASTQDWLKSIGKHEELRRTYLRIMSRVFIGPVHDHWKECRQLLPHVESVGSQKPADKDSLKNWTKVLSLVSHCRHILGEYKEAERMSRQVLQEIEGVFGEGHPETLISLQNLGSILLQQGNLEEAGETIRRVVDRRISLFGEGHLATSESMSMMARVLHAQGQYNEAHATMRLVLQANKQQLPQDHPTMLVNLNFLAVVLLAEERYTEAETKFREVLEKRENYLQKDDIRISTCMNNLATALRYQGRYQEAEEMHCLVLKRREEMLGPSAPMTIQSRMNLAWVLHDAGKYKEAENIGRQALVAGERVLGKEHPETASCSYVLAMALWNLGQFTEAEQMIRQAIERRERYFGKEHPDTLHCMDSLEEMLQDRRERNGGA